MKSLFFYLSCMILFVSCGSRISHQYVHLMPDSTLTSEQSALKVKLGEMIVKHVVIKDNRFIFTARRKEFVKEKIPVSYYKLLKKNMKDNNSFIEENNIVDVDSMYNIAIYQLKLFLDSKNE